MAHTSNGRRSTQAPAERDDEDGPGTAWSGEDNESSYDGEGDVGDGGDGGDSAHSGSKRKRPMSVACEICKARKVKCDRGQPSCGWCVRHNSVCEYRERKKPGLRAGYGKELETRLDRLEGIIRHQQDAIVQLQNGRVNTPASGQTAGDSPFVNGPAKPYIPRPETALFLQKPTSYPSTGTSRQRMFEASPASAVSQNPDYPLLAAASPGVHSSSDIFSQHSHVESPTAPSLAMSHPPHSATAELPPATMESDLPPYDLVYALTDLYFKHINVWCPILHRRATIDALFGDAPLEEPEKVLLHSIVATTLRFSTDPRLTQASRTRYYTNSKQRVLLYGLENSSVRALQALVILSLDQVGASHGPPAWNVMALITRSVVQLGIAIEPDSDSITPYNLGIYTQRATVLPQARDFIEEESRRRLFWMIYLLDRQTTLATAFEFALDSREIKRRLPCREDFFTSNREVSTPYFSSPTMPAPPGSSGKENLGAFSYNIEVVGILADIHLFLKKPVDIGALDDVERWQDEYRQLDRSLTDFFYGLPQEYADLARIFEDDKSTKPISTAWLNLHATYNTTVIRLHSSAAYPTTRSPIFTPSYTASQRCLYAVENLVNICNYITSPSSSSKQQTPLISQLGPPFAFAVWVAARLLLVHSSTISHRIDPSITVLVSTLRALGPYWGIASRYATLLERVLEEYQASVKSREANFEAVGATGAEGDENASKTPSAVKILADMRRTAFDLDYLIFRTPRQYTLSRRPSLARPMTASDMGSGSNMAVSGGQIEAAPAPTAFPPNTSPHFTMPNSAELDCLDMFDFFNMPRLPTGFGHPIGENAHAADMLGPGGAAAVDAMGGSTAVEAEAGDGFARGALTTDGNGGNGLGGPIITMGDGNITSYVLDEGSDWFRAAQHTANPGN